MQFYPKHYRFLKLLLYYYLILPNLYARNYGIAPERAVNYSADETGTKVIYEAVDDAVCAVRESRPLASNWSDKIKKDYETRKKRR